MESRRVLVAFITRSGYTRVVGKAIAQRLRDAGLDVDMADLEICSRHPERYDAVILGCAVHRGHHATLLTEWIDENRHALEQRVTALFSVDPGDHTPALFSHTHWRPQRVLVLAAKEEPFVRRLMREWREEPARKSSTLDWPRIGAFVDELIPIIRAAPRRADFSVLPFVPLARKASAVG